MCVFPPFDTPLACGRISSLLHSNGNVACRPPGSSCLPDSLWCLPALCPNSLFVLALIAYSPTRVLPPISIPSAKRGRPAIVAVLSVCLQRHCSGCSPTTSEPSLSSPASSNVVSVKLTLTSASVRHLLFETVNTSLIRHLQFAPYLVIAHLLSNLRALYTLTSFNCFVVTSGARWTACILVPILYHLLAQSVAIYACCISSLLRSQHLHRLRPPSGASRALTNLHLMLTTAFTGHGVPQNTPPCTAPSQGISYEQI